MISIRKCKKSDLDELIKIEKQSFPSPYPDDLMKYFVKNKNSISLVAEIENKIIGYIFAVLKKGDDGHIVSIAVAPLQRRNKIGGSLLNQVIKIFKYNKANKVVLEVRITNEEAINFYKKFGFEIKGTLKKYYDGKEDAYKMELPL